MEPTILTSTIGVIFFITVIYFGYKFANGKWEVTESKKPNYLIWVDKYGEKVKRAMIIISIIYGVGMGLQILTLLEWI